MDETHDSLTQIKTAHDDLVAELIARWPENKPQPSLERIQMACELLGDPQNACPVIQITGTNGKGSTAIMIDALLRSQGLRTGRFTSPHLVDPTERISIDGEPISKERFDELWHQIAPIVGIVDDQRIDGVAMTFFEVMTALAYSAFADAPVDVAVVEVGMGGVWDATSVATPMVSVITAIGLDHTHVLGSTVAEIASEKAGIIKPTSTAVFAGQEPQAARVLMAHASQMGVEVKREGIDFGVRERQVAVGGQLLAIDGSEGLVRDIFLPVMGVHMAQNLAVAIAAVEALNGGRALSADLINDAMAVVEFPGRLEVFAHEPVIVVDSAHNPHGVRASLAAIQESLIATPVVAVVACMADKAVNDVISLCATQFDHIVATTIPGMPRALSADDLAEEAEAWFAPGQVHRAEDPAAAMILAESLVGSSPDGAIVVIGSVYLAGLLRQQLLDDGVASVRQVPSVQPQVDYDASELVDQPE